MNVLVVEDRPALRRGLVELLQEAGHGVESVGDGLEAIRRGTEHPFDLVVLDLMLPRRDGIEVCRRLRAARPEILVLMLTAKGSEQLYKKRMAALALSYLVMVMKSLSAL